MITLANVPAQEPVFDEHILTRSFGDALLNRAPSGGAGVSVKLARLTAFDYTTTSPLHPLLPLTTLGAHVKFIMLCTRSANLYARFIQIHGP